MTGFRNSFLLITLTVSACSAGGFEAPTKSTNQTPDTPHPTETAPLAPTDPRVPTATLPPTATLKPTPTTVEGLPSGALIPHREFQGVSMWEYNKECLEDRDHPQCFWMPVHPPYNNLAVGEDVILMSTTGELVLFTKDGEELDSITMWEFTRRVMQVPNIAAADARVVYDLFSERFYFVSFYFDTSQFCRFEECLDIGGLVLAASRSARPASFDPSQWHMFDVKVFDPEWPLAVIPDFSSIGVSENAVIVTYSGNRIVPLQYNEIKRVILYEKRPLMRGEEPVEITSFSVPRSQYEGGIPEIQPAVHIDPVQDGSVYLASSGPTHLCNLTMWRANASNLERATIRTSPPCENNSDFHNQPYQTALWAQGGLKDRVVYRNGSIWLAYTVGFIPKLRFVQINVSNWPDVTLVQEATLSESEYWHVAPAIAVSEDNNVAIGFGCGNEDTPASMCYTGRLGTDAPGTLRPPVMIKEGTSPLKFTVFDGGYDGEVIRYTTYQGAGIDPADDTAWLLVEYIPEENSWATWTVNLDWQTVP